MSKNKGILLILVSLCFQVVNAQDLNSSQEVEFHLTPCGVDYQEVKKRLVDKTSKMQIRKNYYFDTEELSYYEEGIIIRARQKNSLKADTSLKLRPFEQQQLTKPWQTDPRVTCEKDIYFSHEKESCVLKEKLTTQQLKDSLKNGKIQDLFSADNLNFVLDNKNVAVNIEELKLYGPVKIEKYQNTYKGLKWDLEFWYLGNQVLMEISFKSTPEELNVHKERLITLLEQNHLQYCTPATSKTQATLKYFQTL